MCQYSVKGNMEGETAERETAEITMRYDGSRYAMIRYGGTMQEMIC